jgi:hypothetical protein
MKTLVSLRHHFTSIRRHRLPFMLVDFSNNMEVKKGDGFAGRLYQLQVEVCGRVKRSRYDLRSRRAENPFGEILGNESTFLENLGLAYGMEL